MQRPHALSRGGGLLLDGLEAALAGATRVAAVYLPLVRDELAQEARVWADARADALEAEPRVEQRHALELHQQLNAAPAHPLVRVHGVPEG